jgi:hypothetical protein
MPVFVKVRQALNVVDLGLGGRGLRGHVSQLRCPDIAWARDD